MTTSSQSLTTEECKKILFKVGIKFGVSPKLISERLLAAQDKCDMLNGEMPIGCLEVAVQAWMDAGKPDYANSPADKVSKTGSRSRQTLPEVEPSQLPLRPPFVRSVEKPEN